MKKQSILALTFAITLAACGGSGNKSDNSGANKPANPNTQGTQTTPSKPATPSTQPQKDSPASIAVDANKKNNGILLAGNKASALASNDYNQLIIDGKTITLIPNGFS